MNESDKAVLSTILTATTSVVTALAQVRKEQMEQKEQLQQLVQRVDQLNNSEYQSRMEDKVLELSNHISQSSTDIKHLVQTTLETFIETDDDTLTTVKDGVEKVIVEQLSKVDNANQIKSLTHIIEALKHMQDDFTNFAKLLMVSSDDIKQLSQSQDILSARINAIDVRIGNISLADYQDTDAGLQTLENSLAMLNDFEKQHH